MNKIIIVAFAILTMVFGSCSNQEAKKDNELLRSKVDSLQNIVTTLQKELDGYKFAPEKLCANVEELFESNKEGELKEILKKLRQYHPEAPEIKNVESYLNKIAENRAKEKERLRAERMKAVEILNKNYDDVNGITWYYSKVTNHRVWSNMASLYIGKDNSTVWLRLKMSYYGEDWIFFDDAYLSYEGNTYTITFDKYHDKKTENSGGMVWEWIDVSVDSDMLAYLNKFVKGNSPKMRLSGKYTNTRNLSAKEIKSMQEILLAYDVLKKGV
jgi:hypothetical protein